MRGAETHSIFVKPHASFATMNELFNYKKIMLYGGSNMTLFLYVESTLVAILTFNIFYSCTGILDFISSRCLSFCHRLSLCWFCFKTLDCERLQLSRLPLPFILQWDGNINQLGWPLKDLKEMKLPSLWKWNATDFLNPVKGHFSPILLSSLFPLQLPFIPHSLFHSSSAPSPLLFLMCNISRRSGNERMIKRRVYSREVWKKEGVMDLKNMS